MTCSVTSHRRAYGSDDFTFFVSHWGRVNLYPDEFAIPLAQGDTVTI